MSPEPTNRMAIDPDGCTHDWHLALLTAGRRVELMCLRCMSSDLDIWPPGGIADLVTLELSDSGIRVSNGQHNSETDAWIRVNLYVKQSVSFTRYGFGGVRATAGNTVYVTPLESEPVDDTPSPQVS